MTCAGGTRVDTRTIATEAKDGGFCDPEGHVRVQECNIEACPSKYSEIATDCLFPINLQNNLGRINVFFFIHHQKEPKCYCENSYGGNGYNGWLCEHNGEFERSGSCSPDEWCIGPTAKENATNAYSALCIGGVFVFEIFLYQTVINFKYCY